MLLDGGLAALVKRRDQKQDHRRNGQCEVIVEQMVRRRQIGRRSSRRGPVSPRVIPARSDSSAQIAPGRMPVRNVATNGICAKKTVAPLSPAPRRKSAMEMYLQKLTRQHAVTNQRRSTDPSHHERRCQTQQRRKRVERQHRAAVLVTLRHGGEEKNDGGAPGQRHGEARLPRVFRRARQNGGRNEPVGQRLDALEPARPIGAHRLSLTVSYASDNSARRAFKERQ